MPFLHFFHLFSLDWLFQRVLESLTVLGISWLQVSPKQRPVSAHGTDAWRMDWVDAADDARGLCDAHYVPGYPGC